MNQIKLTALATSLLFGGVASFASVENAAIGYEIAATSPTVTDRLELIEIKWIGLDSSLWGAYIHTDYRPDEYDASKVLYTLDVKRNGKSVTRATSSEDASTDYQAEYPYPYLSYLTLSEPQTKPGTYTIEIPRGFITNAMTPAYATFINDATTLSFVIEGDAEDDDDDDPTSAIPEGKMVLLNGGPDESNIPDSLDTIFWEWATAAGDPCLWFGPKTLNVKNGNETVAIASVSNQSTLNEDGTTTWNIVLQLDLPVENSGRYIISVPEGAIANSTDPDSATIHNEATDLEYCVLAPAGVTPYLVYPDFNARVEYTTGESLATISLQYSKPVSVNPEKMPFLINEDGDRIYADDIRSFTLEDTGTMLIDFYDAEEFPSGKYLLVVPRGAVVGGNAVRVNYYWESKPEGKTKDEPLEFLKATITTSAREYNLLDPENGIDYVPDQSLLQLSTNYDDICDTYYYQILDVTGLPEDADPTLGDPVIVSFIYSKTGFSHPIFTPQAKPIKISEDHEYMVFMECYSDYQTVMKKHQGNVAGPRFRGGGEAYIYSPTRLIKVDPAPGAEFNASSLITMTFDTPVEFIYEKSGIPMGQMGSERVSTYSSNDDKTVWQFTLSSSTLENFSGPNSINIRFTFDDMNGHRVRPSNLNVPDSDNVTPIRNMGYEETSNICVWYGTYAGCSSFSVVPTPGQKVKSLYDFSYHFNGGEINPSWLGYKLNLTDEQGNVVATMVCDAPKESGGNVHLEQTGSSEDPMTVKVGMHLDREVTEPGVYQLNYPYAYFAMGREENGTHSKPALHTYEIEDVATGISSTIAHDDIVDIYYTTGMHATTIMGYELKDWLANKKGLFIVKTSKTTYKIAK